MGRPPKARTLGALKRSSYRSSTVKQELRRNLIAKIKKSEDLFPGIVGYDDTVIPQIENAILSQHDVILLGERGQAKTRLIRAMINLLDEWIPVIAGSEINDDPFNPVSKFAVEQVGTLGDKTPIAWVNREERYAAPPLLKRLVAMGRYGRKTGAGFYDWTPGGPVALKV